MHEPEPNLDTLGGRVEYAIQQSAYSVEAIANKMRISKQSIYQWIDGRTKSIRNEHLFAFSDLVEMNARWIATGSGERRAPRYEDHRIQHMLRLMEALPDYAIDSAAARLIQLLNSSAEQSQKDPRKKAKVIPFPRQGRRDANS